MVFTKLSVNFVNEKLNRDIEFTFEAWPVVVPVEYPPLERGGRQGQPGWVDDTHQMRIAMIKR